MKTEARKTEARKDGAKEVVITRVFDAPRSLVFAAWTQAEHLARWWGPEDFSNPVCELDLRPGGSYRIVMEGPDGARYPMKGEYLEVAPEERIVYTNDMSEMSASWHDMVQADRAAGSAAPHVHATTAVDFEDLDARTRVTVRMTFVDEALRDAHVRVGMNEGWGQSFDRLDTLLETRKIGDTSDREIVISRLINATPAMVFRAWTRPEHLDQWWGPDGFTTTTERMDFRVGGEWIYTMLGPDGVVYPNAIRYEVIVPDQRIAYAHGEVAGGPAHFHSTVTFVAQGSQTEITLHLVLPTREARDFVVREHGAIEGGEQTLRSLAEFVEAS